MIVELRDGSLWMMLRNIGGMAQGVSTDGRHTWSEGTIAADGTVLVIYDHQRYTENREGNKGVGAVMMAVFREEDVRAGKAVSENALLCVEVSRLAQP
jgi:hypothetical protein